MNLQTITLGGGCFWCLEAVYRELRGVTRVYGEGQAMVRALAGVDLDIEAGEFVVPDDIKGCALAVLRHRVRLSPELDIEGLSVDQVLQQLLDQVPAPRV